MAISNPFYGENSLYSNSFKDWLSGSIAFKDTGLMGDPNQIQFDPNTGKPIAPQLSYGAGAQTAQMDAMAAAAMQRQAAQMQAAQMGPLERTGNVSAGNSAPLNFTANASAQQARPTTLGQYSLTRAPTLADAVQGQASTYEGAQLGRANTGKATTYSGATLGPAQQAQFTSAGAAPTAQAQTYGGATFQPSQNAQLAALGSAAQGQAATSTAPQFGPAAQTTREQIEAAKIDTAQAQQMRDKQMQALQYQEDRVAGKAPSVAELQLQKGLEAQKRAASSMAASARGGNIGLARRQAMQAQNDAQLQTNQSAAILRAQEQERAEQNVASQAGAVRGQDVSQAATQAEFEQQARVTGAQLGAQVGMSNTAAQNTQNLTAAQLQSQSALQNAALQSSQNIQNQQAQNQFALQAAQNANQMNQFNTSLGSQERIQQAQLAQQAGLSNAQLGTQANLSNQQIAAQYGLQNQQLANQMAQYNTGQFNQFALQQAALQQQAGLSSMDAQNQMQQFNLNALNTRDFNQAQLLQQAGMQGAQLQSQQSLANQQAANQFALTQGQMQMDANSQNAQMLNQRALTQAQLDQQNNQFNATQGNSVLLANQQAALQAAMQQQNAYNQMAQYNAGLQQSTNQFNANTYNTGMMQQGAWDQAANQANLGAQLTQQQMNDAMSQYYMNQGFNRDITAQNMALQQYGIDSQNWATQQQMALQAAQANLQQQNNQDSGVFGAVGSVLAAFSDKRTKKNIKELSAPSLENFMASLKPYSYEYKDEKYGAKGKRFGVMAQSLEKSDIGKTVVHDVDIGKNQKRKMVSLDPGVVYASLGHLQAQLDALNAAKGGR